MTKREQVEEMAKHGCYDGCANGLRKFCDEYDGKPCKNMVRIASGLYEQGYQKIDKDSVVLSREEQEKILTATEKRIKELKKQILQARKETAEKILTELLDFVNGWFEGVENNDFGVEFNRISKDLAEKYGVKIKE